MPKKTEPQPEHETTTTEVAPAAPWGTKTAAVRAALKAHPGKLPKAIAELLQAEGWDVKPQFISVVKSNMKGKKRKKAKAAAAAPEAAPVMPKDAVSLGLLQKAKKLAAQIGSVQEAKAALDALAQLMD